MKKSDLVINVQQYRGFNDTLGEAESVLHLKRFITTPGIAGTALARDLSSLIPAEVTFLAPRWREAARKIKDFFLHNKVEVLDKEEAWLPIQIYAIFCPDVTGTKASLSLVSKGSGEAAYKLEILGIGGGKDFTVEFAVNDKIEVDAQSVVVIYRFLTIWEKCQITTTNGDRVVFPRLQLVQNNCNRIETKPLAALTRPSAGFKKTILLEVDLRNTNAVFSRTLTLKSGTKWTDSIGVKLEKFAISCNSEITCTQNCEAEYNYLLQPGHLYRALQSSNPTDWLWEIDGK